MNVTAIDWRHRQSIIIPVEGENRRVYTQEMKRKERKINIGINKTADIDYRMKEWEGILVEVSPITKHKNKKKTKRSASTII